MKVMDKYSPFKNLPLSSHRCFDAYIQFYHFKYLIIYVEFNTAIYRLSAIKRK